MSPDPQTRPAQNVGGLPVFIPDYGVLQPNDVDNVPASDQVAALFDAGTLAEPQTTSEPPKPRRRRDNPDEEK